ncbi:hypothetical protein QBC38DRAFT_447160 [Podospora fimiseda]|uniref:LrgB-like protein n=1 Tax=Podospora fimiseda TaxID=252190 RepID=A0AAN7GXY1_9PEZI|nr:hypothetical protein QBC38DRAFT_447160 [Podospora fimiseda]
MASQQSVVALPQPSTASGANMAPTTQSPPVLLSPDVYRSTLRRISDGIIAIIIAFIAQLLLAGIQFVLSDRGVDFPPSVVAMTGIFLVFSVCGYFFPGVEDFYQKRLKRAADLLNRHMSIGFTIPFIMILRGPMSDAQTIGAIIGCFSKTLQPPFLDAITDIWLLVLTGLLNTLLAYIFALPLQCLMVRWDKGRWEQNTSGDIESAPAAASVEPKPRSTKLRAPIKSLCDSMDSSVSGDESQSDSEATEATTVEYQLPLSLSARLLSWVLANPLLLLLWLLTIMLGLPLRFVFGASFPVFSTLLLFSLWLSTLTLQATIKSLSSLPAWLRTLLSGLLNPVLFTSLAMSAYIFMEASSSSLAQVLSSLQSNTTFSTFILHPSSTGLKAGDIALSILNAGLVSWGLKLYEYRTQLLSRAGLTVFTVSSLLAACNVIGGPLLAHTVGVRPESRALSFAARSVTLALGSPVMVALGGDAGLNAAMVVISGIVYQMGLGFGVGRWLERRLVGGMEPVQQQQQRQEVDSNDPRTVAAGVTVGINAAAMGTAYLYEVHSEAAPFSALSMMALGIMTVVFSTISPLAAWVANSVVS